MQMNIKESNPPEHSVNPEPDISRHPIIIPDEHVRSFRLGQNVTHYSNSVPILFLANNQCESPQPKLPRVSNSCETARVNCFKIIAQLNVLHACIMHTLINRFKLTKLFTVAMPSSTYNSSTIPLPIVASDLVESCCHCFQGYCILR